ncbi:MAG: class I SAM-dependent methyltransferase, partial [Thermodesulfobacteriota bacterium]
MKFVNVYEDSERAKAYAELEFPGTYSLAYRDLPQIIQTHVLGKKALDFGCGTGRSTRFLKNLGFEVIGVDISEQMIQKARARDPRGDYRLIADGDLRSFEDSMFDLVFSIFTFDNIPSMEKKVTLFREFNRLLSKEGRIINLVSSPEIYRHEWVSFTTQDFPENHWAGLGDVVKIIMKDVRDIRPVEDILWTEEGYQKVFLRAGL